MPAISERARQKLENLIRDHHLAFMVEVLGPGSVPKQVYERLLREGFVQPQVHSKDMIHAAHAVGHIAANVSDKDVVGMTPDAFKEYTAVAMPPLEYGDVESLEAVRAHFGKHISDLSREMEHEVVAAVRETNAHYRRDEIINEARKELLKFSKRESQGKILARLKKKFPGMIADWNRILTTELHNLTEEGKASAILRSVPKGTDPRVYKRPRPDACAHCKLLYLVDGKRPRIFRLSQLSANGVTNEGRKSKAPTMRGNHATEWLPTLGSVHPFCQCSLNFLPDGFTFDLQGNLVYVGMRKGGMDVDVLPTELRELIEHKCEEVAS